MNTNDNHIPTATGGWCAIRRHPIGASLRWWGIAVLFAGITVLPLAAAPYTDNNDGSVTDARTNLRWQQCSNGQTYSGGTCTGSATTVTWANALTYCNELGLASKSWRLPSINELSSIVDRRYNPAINATYFPATVSSLYWSSSTYVPDTTLAWIVPFNNGYSATSNKTFTNYVRCVSSGP